MSPLIVRIFGFDQFDVKFVFKGENICSYAYIGTKISSLDYDLYVNLIKAKDPYY